MSEIQTASAHEPTTTIDTYAKEVKRAELARKAGRFRILIVGRANAGKTTILKKICNTTDDPDIYDSAGHKVDPSKIEPTPGRGIHDITDEMIFRSNPGFIFHDSRGFEAGGVDELQKVKKFLSERSNEKKLENQVHVVWYCIPMDDSRPITNAEVQFFSKFGTGKVPVIAVFTKCEALELTAIEILETEENLSYRDAVKRAPQYARENLWNTHLDLAKQKFSPRGHVYLQEMERPETSCKELVECTASVLNSDTLQALFVSTQQVSLEISVRYATKKILDYETSKPEDRRIWVLGMFGAIMEYFPCWTIHEEEIPKLETVLQRRTHELKQEDKFLKKYYNKHLNFFTTEEIGSIAFAIMQIADPHASASIQAQVIHIGTALTVIAEHLYFIWRHSKSVSAPAVPIAVTQYQLSSQGIAITGQVAEGITEYLDSVAELEKSIWRHAKDVVQKRKSKNHFKDVLQKRLEAIVLANRLDKTGL